MKSIKQLYKSILFRIDYYLMPDKIYLNKKFKKVFGREINWKNPITFNEKLQWLKIYDRNPLYTQLVDKYGVRRFVSEKVGAEYLIPCLGVWDCYDNIDFDKLPRRFVLKCTHDSHSVVICKDKSTFNYERAKKSLSEHLNRNFYYNAREWPYKNVKPRIIAEQYIEDKTTPELKDYKFMCFNGKVKCIQVHTGRFGKHIQNYYDINWNKMNISQPGSPSDDKIDLKPKCLEKMIELSEVLANGLPEIRVDWYLIGEKIYFGELTFFDGSGFVPFEPDEWDRELGSWLILPNK